MSTTADAVARANVEIEQALGLMRTQMTAFRRTAASEVMASYPRITAAIGRQDFLVSQKRSKEGLKELLDESELLAWDVPQLLEQHFTEAWMLQCFTVNDSYPDTTACRIYDYLRGRGRPESPFPAYFAEELAKVFYPLGRMLKRSGYDIGPATSADHGARGDRADIGAFPRLAEHYKMHPALIAGATVFGEQARRCHTQRQGLKKLELVLAEEKTRALWDQVESERKKKTE